MTTAPSAPVDICKLALTLMGEKSGSIANIESPQNRIEELMALWYDQCRRQVLREQVWNFAQKERDISRSGDGQGLWEDAYALPNDFVRLNRVGEDPDYPLKRYDLGDRVIYANEGSTLHIVYNRDIVTVSSFDPLFVNALALTIGIKTAFEITKKRSVVKDLSDLLALDSPKAVGVDGQERPMKRVQTSKYLAARRGGVLIQDPRYYY